MSAALYRPKYIAVKCSVCKHEDGIAEELLHAGETRIFCDVCAVWRESELAKTEAEQ